MAAIIAPVVALSRDMPFMSPHPAQTTHLNHRRTRDEKKEFSHLEKGADLKHDMKYEAKDDSKDEAVATGNHEGTRKSKVSSAASAPLVRRASSAKRKKNMAIPMAHIRPGHVTNSESLLTRDKTSTVSSPSYAGFGHLAMIILLVGELRLILQDYSRDGVLVTLFRLGITKKDAINALILFSMAPVHILVAYAIERSAVRTLISENEQAAVAGNTDKNTAKGDSETNSRVDYKSTDPSAPKYLWPSYAFLHALNCIAALSITSYTVYWILHHPFIGTICECHALILCLKLASYALVNRDLRYLMGSAHVPDLYRSNAYPKNLNLKNIFYFWWAPTLMYQPVYPRTQQIRWKFVGTCVAEMFGAGVLIWFLAGQYAVPTLRASLPFFVTGDAYGIFESLLRLSGVSIFIWLLGFYFIFQSYLNFLAELLRFGDRDFYQDWWNSGSVGSYWRLWNRPVRNYFKRHVYVPLLKRGYSPVTCSLIVFFVSAVLHEMLVGIPTKQIIGVAFACMIFQAPLVIATAPLENMRGPGTTIGNCVFWLSFFFGQPFAVLIYYYSWNVKYGVLKQ